LGTLGTSIALLAKETVMPERFPPQHWRKRAADVRVLAATIGDKRTRELLYNVAEAYEEIEHRAEARRPMSSRPSWKPPTRVA
jgi:hypothetical protein